MAYAGLTATAVDALAGSVTEAAWRGHWVADWTLGTPALLLGGVLLARRIPFGYVIGPGLLLVSGLGGIAFAIAAIVNNVAGDLLTEWSMVVVHRAISAASLALLTWFLHSAALARGVPGGPARTVAAQRYVCPLLTSANVVNPSADRRFSWLSRAQRGPSDQGLWRRYDALRSPTA